MGNQDLKVLLVDDDPTMLRLLSHGLSADNDLFEVLSANNAEEAINFLERIHIPLVVSDIQMPVISGLDLMAKIRERWPHVSVILMTGNPTRQLRDDVRKSGCLQFFQKPIKTRELRAIIEKELSGGNEESGFDGTLKNIQLPDLIQMCCSSSISTVIQVKKDGMIGTIFIEDGEIIHADCGETEGIEAFYTIFTWQSGSFETLGDIAVPKTTIDKNWQFLLMEGHRRMDEAAAAAEEENEEALEPGPPAEEALQLAPEEEAGPDFMLTPDGGLHEPDAAELPDLDAGLMLTPDSDADGADAAELPNLDAGLMLTPDGEADGADAAELPDLDAGLMLTPDGKADEPDAAELPDPDAGLMLTPDEGGGDPIEEVGMDRLLEGEGSDGIVLLTDEVKPLRTLIVDDSGMMCKVLTDMLSSDERIDVIGSAKNGQEALEMAESMNPDLITLDVNMPVMDGSTALKHIMIKNPCPVVIVSAVNSRSQGNIIDFLQLGAVDFVPKPIRSKDMEKQQQYLIKRILQASQANIHQFKRARSPKTIAPKAATDPLPAERFVVICSGPGGYAELIKLLPLFPENTRAGVIVLQSMSNAFAEPLAGFLDSRSRLDIFTLDHEAPAFTGQCYLAVNENPIQLKPSGPGYAFAREEGHETMPDLFLSSIALYFGAQVMVVLMSGADTGSLSGLRHIKKNGGLIIGQDVKTCLVPKPIEAVEEAGLLSGQMGIPDIMKQIHRHIG